MPIKSMASAPRTKPRSRRDHLAEWLYLHDWPEQPKPDWFNLKKNQPQDAKHFLDYAAELLKFLDTV